MVVLYYDNDNGNGNSNGSCNGNNNGNDNCNGNWNDSNNNSINININNYVSMLLYVLLLLSKSRASSTYNPYSSDVLRLVVLMVLNTCGVGARFCDGALEPVL